MALISKVNRWRSYNKFKVILCISLVIFLYALCYWVHQTPDLKDCFNNFKLSTTDNKTNRLEDVLESTKKPKLGRSIFFHETSCYKKKKIELNARQACAVESAALANPNLDVFLLFATAYIQDNTSKNPFLNAILSYPNVYIRSVNLWTYAESTPAAEWINDGKLFKSNYVLSHTSDFLRYLTLWRFGGTYLDMDVIVKKSLENIEPNYAGAESDTHVAAGIMNFDSDGFGHQIADLCLTNFIMGFDGTRWGHNGPGVITRVLQKICNTNFPQLMTSKRCLGFKVYPLDAFYAVRWWNWEQFFKEEYSNDVLKLTNDSIIVHVWNKHSSNKSIKVGSKAAYAILAEKHCPRVYSSSGKYF